MSDTDTVNNVADPIPDIELSSEELRNVRIRRFAQRPIRYRQLIGEQVLNNRALANSVLADASVSNSESAIQSSLYDYGDEEANKFLQDVDHSIVSGKSSDNESNPCNCVLKEIIALHSMENFSLLTNLVFGRSQSLFFTAIPEAVMHKKYHTLEQLSALAILTIGRGPSCLNKLLVHTLFEAHDYSLMLPEKDLDEELAHYLKCIEEGDVSTLVDANIMPSNNLNRNTEMFINFYCIIS